jgi:MarR family transcriptional regulator for hemolysin
MSPKELFAYELGKVYRNWRTRFDCDLKSFHMTAARALALYFLLRAERPMTQTELAMELAIEHPTCVRLLDALERQKLVERKGVKEDRRVKQVCLTKAGRLVAARVALVTKRRRERYLKGIGPDDMKAAMRVLSVIAANMELADEPCEPRPRVKKTMAERASLSTQPGVIHGRPL